MLCQFSLSFLSACLASTVCGLSQDASATNVSPHSASIHYAWGEAKDGLRPRVFIERGHDTWNFAIDFLFETNFPRHAWLKTTNRVGSKLQMWLRDGSEVVPRSVDVRSAFALPKKVAVEEILGETFPQSSRGLQWLQTDFNGSRLGEFALSTTFALDRAFGIPITTDVVVRITPLVYSTDSKGEFANLVEFRPIKIKLMSNGSVEADHIERELNIEIKDGLRSDVVVTKYGRDWNVKIRFLSLASPSSYTWYKITNQFGARVEAWASAGEGAKRLKRISSSVAELPVQHDASSITTMLPSSVIQRWQSAGILTTSSEFFLSELFQLPPTNDIVINLAPLMYRVGADSNKAELVEFGPVRVELRSNGEALRLN